MENQKLNSYLTFKMDGENFAIDVSVVQNIQKITSLTKVPYSHEYMLGIMNLYGKGISIIDLKMMINGKKTKLNDNTCIIIISFYTKQITFGLVVDSVSDLFDMKAEEIQPISSIGNQIKIDFISGMYKKGEDFVMIMNIDKIISLI